MPITVSHQLSATTPDDPGYEIKPSNWNDTHAVTFNALGSEISGAFTNGGGVSFGLSANGYLSASVKTDYLTTAMASNRGTDFVQATAGFAGTNASGTIASNGISVSVGNYITTARASNDAVGLNTAFTAGPLAWTVNSSGLSLNAVSAAGTTSGFGGNLISGSMTHNTAGLNLSLNHPAWLTTAMQSNAATISNINVSAGTTSNNLSALTFSNANGVSFGINASTITGSVATSYRASNDAVGLNSALTAGPLAWTVNSAGISLNAGSAAGTTSGFAGNLISGSMTHNTAGLNLSLNHPAWLTTARGSSDAIGLNTAQSNVTWTVNSAGLSLDARGYAGTATTFNGANISGSMTLNSAGLNLSLSGAGGGTTNQTGPNIAAGTQTATSGTVVFSNSNGISFGMSNSSVVTASVDGLNIGVSNLGNTSGTTGTVDGHGGQYLFVGSQGITLSQSTNGASSGTVTILGNPPRSFFQNVPVIHGTQTFNAASSTIYVYPFELPFDMSISIIRLPMSLSAPATTGGVPGANSTITGNQGWTHGIMFYTQGVGNSSNSLQQYTSTSGTGSFGTSIGAAAQSSQQTVTINGSFNQSGVETNFGTGTSYGVSSGSYVVNSSAMSNFTGPRFVDIPFATTLSAGNYWIGIGKSVSTANNSTIFNGVDVKSSNIFISQTNITWGIIGSVTNTSNIMRQPGAGFFTTNASIYTTASINAVGQISVTTSNLVPYFQLLRKA